MSQFPKTGSPPVDSGGLSIGGWGGGCSRCLPQQLPLYVLKLCTSGGLRMSNDREAVVAPGQRNAPRRGRCRGCGEKADREWITVRLYLQRFQREFRYHVCRQCKAILITFLEGNAEATTKSLFDPPSERQKPELTR